MSESRAARTTRVIAAPPAALYAAFVDPAVLVAWLPPAGMTGTIHAFDARVGGLEQLAQRSEA